MPKNKKLGKVILDESKQSEVQDKKHVRQRKAH